MADKISIAGQIAEVHRELALRQNVYPSRVAAGKMRQSEADLCLPRMRAVLDTLMFCQQHEPAIRAYIAERKTIE